MWVAGSSTDTGPVPSACSRACRCSSVSLGVMVGEGEVRIGGSVPRPPARSEHVSGEGLVHLGPSGSIVPGQILQAVPLPERLEPFVSRGPFGAQAEVTEARLTPSALRRTTASAVTGKS